MAKILVVDDDSDGNVDCNDWNCQYSSNCENIGVNAANYSDTMTPQVIGVKLEEYPDSALIMYDTNKPSNGTLEFYSTDSNGGTSGYDIVFSYGTNVAGQNLYGGIFNSKFFFESNSRACAGGGTVNINTWYNCV